MAKWTVLVAALALLATSVACGGGEDGASATATVSSTATITATLTPTPTVEPQAKSRERAEMALLDLQDLPSGFYLQSSDIQDAASYNPTLLAHGVRSFAGQPITLETLPEAL